MKRNDYIYIYIIKFLYYLLLVNHKVTLSTPQEQKHRTPLPPQGVSEELTEWLLTCLQDFGNMGQIWVKFIDSKPYSVYCSEEHVIDALKLISNISTFKSMPLPLFTNKRESMCDLP